MARERTVACEYYTHEGCMCTKRGIPCHFWAEMQKCKKYNKKAGGRPARTDNRAEKRAKAANRELRKEIY